MNPYEILGISYSADMKDVKKAFRQRVLETHPDRVKDKEEEFRQVIAAMEMISKGWNPAISDDYPTVQVSEDWYYSPKSYDNEELFWEWVSSRSHDEYE